MSPERIGGPPVPPEGEGDREAKKKISDTQPEQAITPEQIEAAPTVESPAMPEKLTPPETPTAPAEKPPADAPLSVEEAKELLRQGGFPLTIGNIEKTLKFPYTPEELEIIRRATPEQFKKIKAGHPVEMPAIEVPGAEEKPKAPGLIQRFAKAVGRGVEKTKRAARKIKNIPGETVTNLEVRVRRENIEREGVRRAKIEAERELEKLLTEGKRDESFEKAQLEIGQDVKIRLDKKTDKGWIVGGVFEQAGVKGVKVYKIDKKTGKLLSSNASLETLQKLNKPPLIQRVRENLRRRLLGLEVPRFRREAPPEAQRTAEQIEQELEEIPAKERAKIGLGLSNFGFFVQEQKSRLMEKLCSGLPRLVPQHEKGTTIDRFFKSFSEIYRRDAEYARRKMETQAKSKTALGQAQNVGYLMGNILKYGRTVADVVGWTAGAPLRYMMLAAQFFSRGAEAAKEARLKNEELIAKTRIEDIDQAAEQAWKIYEEATKKAPAGKTVSAKDLEKAYAEQLPQDLMERLKKSPPGTAGNFLSRLGQGVLRWDIEKSLKLGRKLPKDYFEKRLKEFDRLIDRYGTVDTVAMLGRYAESAGKGAIAAIQIETMYLLIKNLPDIVRSISGAAGEVLEKEAPATSTPLASHLPEARPIIVPPPEQPAAPAASHLPEAETVTPPPEQPTAPRIEIQPEVRDVERPLGLRPMEGVQRMEIESAPAGAGAAETVQEAGRAAQAAAETSPPSGEYVEVAERGDSVWSMAREQLERHYGTQFHSLNAAQQTYLIDAVKDRIVANPGAFGLTDPDRLEVGQRIDFSSVFSDQEDIQGDIADARGLSETAMENIRHNNALIRQWVENHPHQRLDSEEVERILSQQGTKGPVGPKDILETIKPPKLETFGNVINPHETNIVVPDQYNFGTVSGSVSGHFNVEGRIITGVEIDGPMNYSSINRLFTDVDNTRAAEEAFNAGRLPEGMPATAGPEDIYNRAARIDLALRFRNAFSEWSRSENSPYRSNQNLNRQYAVDYLNGFIRRLVRDTEDIYGNVFKDESRILRMRN